MGPSDLSRRALVVIVGVPAVVGALYVGGWVLTVPVALLGAQAAAETYDLAEARDVRPFRWLGMFVAGSYVLFAAGHPTFRSLSPWVLGAVLLLSAASLVMSMATRWPDGKPLAAAAVTVFGALYGGLALAFVPLLRALPAELGWGGTPPSPWAGVAVVALPLATTWIGDGSAYFVGTAWGRKRMAPTLSPGKSWVGAYAGVGGAALAAVGWYAVSVPVLSGLELGGLWQAALAGAVLGVVAQVGDLAESLLKREAGAKDSGGVFPGHGGVLDRTDSLIFALPVAYLIFLFTTVSG
ncbi:MAG TPA: phosphatidate cytidylyltransferase [Longimicrobiales bacterium]|nr:phosphatidate cytidylyltransferase [Longimicrobiales bacterium]